MRTICVATGTRADWGILRPLAASLRDSGKVALKVMATNMHLLEAYGHTVDEIIANGFTVDARVPLPDAAGDSPLTKAKAMGVCVGGTAEALELLNPDAIVILGDRYEMLAVASAAAVMDIPIIHLHGGEISEGAIDDSIRHAITKLSTLHLTATEPYRQRVIQLGEQPEMVHNIGSLGVWSIVNGPRISRGELCAELGMDPDKQFAVTTFHPATLDTVSPGKRCVEMVNALNRFAELNVIATYPNNDSGSEEIIDVLREWQQSRPKKVRLVKSLGMRRYLSAIAEAKVVVGNSSSAIIEVPAAGTPAVNIGIRQRGRLHSELVIDTGDSAEEIVAAIERAFDPEFVKKASLLPNPYYKPDTLKNATDIILGFMDSLPMPPKKFYDIKAC